MLSRRRISRPEGPLQWGSYKNLQYRLCQFDNPLKSCMKLLLVLERIQHLATKVLFRTKLSEKRNFRFKPRSDTFEIFCCIINTSSARHSRKEAKALVCSADGSVFTIINHPLGRRKADGGLSSSATEHASTDLPSNKSSRECFFRR